MHKRCNSVLSDVYENGRLMNQRKFLGINKINAANNAKVKKVERLRKSMIEILVIVKKPI